MMTSLNMTSFKTSRSLRRKASARGFTIVEFLMAVAIAGVILSQTCLLWLYSSKCFAGQMGYADMDQKSQLALDTLSRSIRQCRALTNFTTTRVTFLDHDNKALTFAFDAGRLVRIKTGSAPKILLKDCTDGEFVMYQRTPIAGGFDYHPVTNSALCKAVEVRWNGARKFSPTSPNASESMQSARIVMRVK